MSIIPTNFPRRAILSSLAGAAPKLALRRTAEDVYTNEISDEEYLQAYEIAEDFAHQMKQYVLSKEIDDPLRTREFSLQRIRKVMD